MTNVQLLETVPGDRTSHTKSTGWPYHESSLHRIKTRHCGWIFHQFRL